MLGLFDLGLDGVLVKTTVNRPNVVPIKHFNLGVNYLLSGIFVYYFATFKCSSFRSNFLCCILRFITLFVYVPLLLYVGAYIDGAIIAILLFSRICYLLVQCALWRSPYYLILNSANLAWILGKCWYVDLDMYVCLRGGDSYVKFGPHFIPFIRTDNLFISVRGRKTLTAHLVRRVELINGDFLYIFDTLPLVSVVNTIPPSLN
nr:ORF3 [Alphacoronavirus sp.]